MMERHIIEIGVGWWPWDIPTDLGWMTVENPPIPSTPENIPMDEGIPSFPPEPRCRSPTVSRTTPSIGVPDYM